MTFEHGAEPLRLKAAGLREVRAYLRAEYPDKHIASVKDELGNLAGCPPATTKADPAHWRLVIALTPVVLVAAGYG